MRIFQNLGIADQLAPYVCAYKRSEYRAADGGLLRSFRAAAEPFPLSWPPNMSFLQPELERLLRERAVERSNFTMSLGSEVVAVEEAGEITVRYKHDARIELATCRYAVGCDGGSSFVRRNLGIKFEDLTFDEPWLVVDVILNSEVELPDVNIQYCNPNRPTTFVHGPGQIRRWELMLLPGEDPTEMTDEGRIWELLAPWIKPEQGRIWRAAPYRFHALVAERWRSGHVFIAGTLRI